MDLSGREGISADQALFVSDLIRTAMVNTGLFVVVDRQAINKVLEEQALQKTGVCSDTSCTVKVGQLLAANKIMTGSVIKIGTRISINVNIIDVEKASIDFAESQSADSIDRVEDATLGLSDRIAKRITGRNPQKGMFAGVADRADGGALWRSAVLPGWGQYRSGQTWKAAGMLGGTLVSLFLVSRARSDYLAAEREYNSTSSLAILFPSDRESIPLTLLNLVQSGAIQDRQNEAAGRGQLFLGLLGGVYLYNLIDAAFFGRPVPAAKAAAWDRGSWQFGFAAGTRRSFQVGVVVAF